MRSVALPALPLLLVCCAGCGQAGGRTATRPPAGVDAASVDAPGVTHDVRGFKGDSDDDDTAAELNGPATKPADGDNDLDNDPRDNALKGYYDNDDGPVWEYGRPATAAESVALATLVTRYFTAARHRDGQAACAMLDAATVRAVPEDYGRPPGPPALRGKSCPAVVSKLFRLEHPELTDSVYVTGVRVEGAVAHVQLGSRTLPAGFIVVKREGGAWGIDQPLGKPLP